MVSTTLKIKSLHCSTSSQHLAHHKKKVWKIYSFLIQVVLIFSDWVTWQKWRIFQTFFVCTIWWELVLWCRFLILSMFFLFKQDGLYVSERRNTEKVFLDYAQQSCLLCYVSIQLFKNNTRTTSKGRMRIEELVKCFNLSLHAIVTIQD